MTVRAKTLVITAFTLAGLVALLYASARLVVLRGFGQLEQQMTRWNVERSASTLQDDLITLETMTRDWAIWDDTYQFIEDRNEGYIAANLTETTFINLRIDFIAFVNAAGRTVIAEAFDQDTRQQTQASKSLAELLSPGSPLVSFRDTSDHHSGMVWLAEGPVLLASWPILTSDGKGPIRGALMMGRRLTEREIGRLAERTKLQMAMLRVDDARLPSDCVSARSSLLKGADPVVQVLGRDRVAGYQLLRDIYGKPTVLLRVESPRAAYRQGEHSLFYLVVSLIIGCAVVGMASTYLLNKVIVSRLARLREMVSRAGIAEPAPSAGASKSRDEISGLESAMEVILKAIANSAGGLAGEGEELGAILDSVPTGVVIVDAETHRILDVNQAALAMLGVTKEEVVGAACREYVCPQERERCPVTDLNTQVSNRECVLSPPGGEEIPIMKSVAQIAFRGRSALLETFVDMRAQKHAEEMLQHEAHYDALTDLPNRRSFSEALASAVERARVSKAWLAVLFLDLDRFKVINDALGHHAGDQLLRDAAQRLRMAIPEKCLLARWGGDEFAVFDPRLPHARAAAELARRILSALSEGFRVGEHAVHISGSVGISLYPEDGEDAFALMGSADAALFHAKDQGRDRYEFFTPSLNAEMQHKVDIEAGLRHALEAGEFVLHYQPQIALASGEPIGAEALIRWQHPELGLVPPGEFIPLAEETGLVEPMGKWVLWEACRQRVAWHREGALPASVPVAVNLSPRQFNQKDLVQMIERTLADTGMRADQLQLEITETAVMRDLETSLRMLQALRELGVGLAVDDFGLGHSSLVYLKQFPVETLKVDRCFISNVTTDPDDQAITSAIVAMAHSLRLGVIAEGVEKAEQLAFLRSLECDAAQGFLFSRPVPASQLLGTLAARRWAELTLGA